MVKEFKEHQYWALILGGSSGLGLAAALKLASHGMNICLVHRNSRSELDEIALNFDAIKSMQVQLLTFNVDAIKPESRKLVVEALTVELNRVGKVRCLLHSIAKGNLKPLVNSEASELDSTDFLITLQHMAISLNDWTKDLYKANLFAEDARILSFTSEGAHKALPNYAAVAAAKAALEAITRNIASEYAPFGIRANCIQAGVTDTASLRKIPGYEELIQHSIQRNPFKRLTTSNDVANMVYLLCKDEAAWINGAVLPVDGGEHIR
jgi:enoyl-[acyl-carrier protein] reductase III